MQEQLPRMRVGCKISPIRSLTPALPRNPAVGRTHFLLPRAGEGGPQGRMREEAARFQGSIRGQGGSSGLSQREREKYYALFTGRISK